MAVGQGSRQGYESYMAVGRETTYGTYSTCTSALHFESDGFKLSQNGKIIEQVTGDRTYAKRVKLGKVVGGEVSGYFYCEALADNYILQNAFGGAITSATATGETAGGAAFTHTIEIGDMENSYTSLCFNERKGGSSDGQVFEYNGGRVNEFTLSQEIDDALKFSSSIVCKDATATSNDVESAFGVIDCEPLNFIDGRISVETTFAGLTSTSFWHVQSVTFGVGNSLKSESEARRIGSDTLDVLPAGVASFTFNATIRFDTTTAYDAMLAETQLSAQLEWQGSTLAGSVIRRGMKINMPVVYIDEAGLPEIGGPDEVLTSEVTFHVLRDDSSASSYAVQAEVTNLTANYD